MDPTTLGRDFRNLIDRIERTDGISASGRTSWEPWPEGLSVDDLVERQPAYAQVPRDLLDFARAAGYLRAYLEWWEGGADDKPSDDDETGYVNISIGPFSPVPEGYALHEAGYVAQGPSVWRIDEVQLTLVETTDGQTIAVDDDTDADEPTPSDRSLLEWLGRAVATAGLSIPYDAETLDEEASFYDSLDEWTAAARWRKLRDLGVLPAEVARRYYPELVERFG